MAKCQIEPLWETYTRTSVEWHALPGRSQGAFSRFSRLFFFLELPRRFPRRSINYFPPHLCVTTFCVVRFYKRIERVLNVGFGDQLGSGGY